MHLDVVNKLRFMWTLTESNVVKYDIRLDVTASNTISSQLTPNGEWLETSIVSKSDMYMREIANEAARIAVNDPQNVS